LFYFHACYNILGEATVHVVFDHEDVLKDVDAVFKLHEDTPTFVDNLMWRFAGKAALYALVDGWCYIRINDKYPSVDSIFQEINNSSTNTSSVRFDIIFQQTVRVRLGSTAFLKKRLEFGSDRL